MDFYVASDKSEVLITIFKIQMKKKSQMNKQVNRTNEYHLHTDWYNTSALQEWAEAAASFPREFSNGAYRFRVTLENSREILPQQFTRVPELKLLFKQLQALPQ